MLTSMSLLDIFIILGYFGIILWIAQWASKSKSASGGAVDYFLAGKNSGWLVIGASLFASNIGSSEQLKTQTKDKVILNRDPQEFLNNAPSNQ